MAEVHIKQIGLATVKVWQEIGAGAWWSCAPWRFSILFPGKGEIVFSGVPNYCETKRVAMMRAWHRAKWLNNGTYDQHYIAQ